MRGRLSLDLMMFALMLLAFAYQLTGNRVHEIVGTAFVVFAAAHNVLARWWYGALRKGKYVPRRTAATILNLLLLASALSMVVTGVANSHDLFPFFKSNADILDRRVHAWASYWVLVLASLHIGLHWPLLKVETLRLFHVRDLGRRWGLAPKSVAAGIVGFGVYAAWERNLHLKLVGAYGFDFWDFEHATFGFFARYVAIVAVGVCLAHFGQKRLHKVGPERPGRPRFPRNPQTG
jgi:hypothetical protein